MTATAEASAPALHDALELVLADVTDQTPSIRSFTFRDPAGNGLPPYVPGSHVIVQCGDKANAYSLTGSGVLPDEYTISVLRVDDGGGGSATLHRLAPGARLTVSRPRSAFAPVATARHHLLIAAGIGITPMLSHMRAAAEWGHSASLLYSYRQGEGAHLDDVRELCGESLHECTDRSSFLAALAVRLGEQPLGTHLYVCGPQGFMDTVLHAASEAGWPASRLHSEPFGSADLDPGQPFSVRLSRSGTVVDVPSGTSLLEALEDSGLKVPFMCRQGVCGECVLPVLRGTPEHRDLYLSDAEKTANNSIMCCVSRSRDAGLEIDF
ncbi:PDR/VanB family oxidoreductase [Arthrobacter ramosus]|uniref:PDR/VanB family oxidoreductase n=1 Tax=Arthrobacter ramosus TaxID=1672 RepID=A0ABV5XZP2_ARTRM|nr:PDR/VanB family oxidoreductase [Arthrobacter ramosus]